MNHKKKRKVEKSNIENIKQLCKIINGTELINGRMFPTDLKRLIFTYLTINDLIQFELSFKSMGEFINSVYREIVLNKASNMEIKKFAKVIRSEIPICCKFDLLFHKKLCSNVFCKIRVCESGDWFCFKCKKIFCLKCKNKCLKKCSRIGCNEHVCLSCKSSNFKSCDNIECINEFCIGCHSFFGFCNKCKKR